MFLRQCLAAIATFAILLVSIVFSAVPVQAAETACTTKIVDQTSELLLDADPILQAIATAESTGADIYVRAFQTTPDGGLGKYYRDTVANCPNWRSPDDVTPKANLIVISFAMDRTSEISYGSSWHILDGTIDKIRAESFNTYLRGGKYTDAVTNTVSALQKAIDTPPIVSPLVNKTTTGEYAMNTAAIIIVAIVFTLLIAGGFFAFKKVRRHTSNKNALNVVFNHEKTEAQKAVQTAEASYSKLTIYPYYAQIQSLKS